MEEHTFKITLINNELAEVKLCMSMSECDILRTLHEGMRKIRVKTISMKGYKKNILYGYISLDLPPRCQHHCMALMLQLYKVENNCMPLGRARLEVSERKLN